MKANGYLTSMQQFGSFFGLKLLYLIFAATEQLSLTLQGKDTTIQEGYQAAVVARSYFEKQRTDAAYDTFYSVVVTKSKDMTDDPVLPRRRPPRRIDSDILATNLVLQNATSGSSTLRHLILSLVN